MRNTTLATIDLSAIRYNLEQVRARCPHSKIMAMVKANAYGHGLIPVAKALCHADGLAVARLQEAMLLREAGITQRLLLLPSLVDRDDLFTCGIHNIDVVVHDEHSLAHAMAVARTIPLRIWLKFDSGMHRAGFEMAHFREADRVLRGHSGIRELIHMTHFSCAVDSVSRAVQLERFAQCREGCLSAPASVANSAALIASTDTHTDWVRPGIMLYGVNPFSVNSEFRLKTVMHLTSHVIAIRTIASGENVGYDQRWISSRNSRIGTIGIGYGDGYSRTARAGTPIQIRSHRVPIVGVASMDSLTVDLTDFDDVSVGDQATMWGPELPVAEVAESSRLSAYALLASLTERVDRQYAS